MKFSFISNDLEKLQLEKYLCRCGAIEIYFMQSADDLEFIRGK